jgi:hypothetical protein
MHPLAYLQTLSNRDKHRVLAELTATASQVAINADRLGQDFAFHMETISVPGPIHSGGHFVDVSVERPVMLSEPFLFGEVVPTAVFAEEGFNIAPTLREIHFVAEGAVQEFEAHA